MQEASETLRRKQTVDHAFPSMEPRKCKKVLSRLIITMSTKLTKKITSVVLALTTAIFVSGSLFVPSAGAAAMTTAETIQQLLNQIADLQARLLALQGGNPVAAACTFTRSLFVGVSAGDDVMCLQQYLNGAGHRVAASGAGSPGNETRTFGPLTRAAVAAWQEANGVRPAAGYFGSISRAKYTSLAVAPPPPPPPPPPLCGTTGQPACPVTPAGTGLTVSAGTHPATGLLHPDNAVRVPYTAAVFTASADGAVTVNSVTVERQGASTDATFSGVVLLNENGVQVGLEKTLNSNHQAIMSEPFTIPAGTSRTMWIAANRTTGGTNGTQASFALVAVSSAATVNGTLPIVGTTRTMNVGGLPIGTVTVATGVGKSVATTTEDAGKTMIFTAIKVTAGSVEDVLLKSIRFNQVGTIGSNDITGLEVKVGETVYPHTVSSDGKYFTATFANGITVTKGNSVEATFGGTLAGGTNRTVKFDVYRMTDIAVDGKLYGYGINPTAGTGFTSTNPVYFASQVTVGKATMNVEKDPAVASTNIAINLADQPLGGLTVDVKGEPISVASIVFQLGINGLTGSNVTQVKIIGPTGQVVAGPVDGTGTASAPKVTFSDTVTFPVGKGSYKLIGKLSTSFTSNASVSASTTPSSNWTTVTGQTTGETITPAPSSSITGNTMTVKAASLSLSVSPSPIAQTVVSGVTGFTFANYTFDAQASGEDLRVASVPLAYDARGNTATNLTSCQLFDGVTSKTTGSNIVNPTATASSTTFTFDGSGLVVTKGTVKTLALKCNIAGGATGSYAWGIDSAGSFTGTGLTSGQSITPVASDNSGQIMTLAASGSYTVTDDSTPGYRIVNANATGVTLARLKFAALNEDVDIRQIRLQLTTVASNTPLDLANSMVTLYNEAAPTVPLGTAQFGSGGVLGADLATTTFSAGTFVIPVGGSKTLIVKGDIAGMSVNGPLTFSGDLLKVDYDGTLNTSTNGGNYGVGQSSGSEIDPASADTGVQGVRIMKAYPVFAKLSVPNNLLETRTNKTLYRFSVQAVGGDVRIAKLTFNQSSSTGANAGATTSKYSLFAYNDAAFSGVDTSFSGTGLLNASQCYGTSKGKNGVTVPNTTSVAGSQDIEIFMDAAATACGTAHSTTTYRIRGGETKYFDFRADIASVETTSGSETFTVVVRGDSAFPTAHQGNVGSYDLSPGEMGIFGTSTPTGVRADTNNDFIWMPGSTSSSPTINDIDFTNGYQVQGLPANDMPGEVYTSAN